MEDISETSENALVRLKVTRLECRIQRNRIKSQFTHSIATFNRDKFCNSVLNVNSILADRCVFCETFTFIKALWISKRQGFTFTDFSNKLLMKKNI